MLHHAVARADQTAIRPALAAPAFHHLALDMDGIADPAWVFDRQFHMQEGETGVLLGGLGKQPLGKGVSQRAGDRPALDVAFMGQEFDVGEQHLGHAGRVDEGDQVGFGHGAGDGAEFPPDRKILVVQPKPHHFVFAVRCHAGRPSGPRMFRAMMLRWIWLVPSMISTRLFSGFRPLARMPHEAYWLR